MKRAYKLKSRCHIIWCVRRSETPAVFWGNYPTRRSAQIAAKTDDYDQDFKFGRSKVVQFKEVKK